MHVDTAHVSFVPLGIPPLPSTRVVWDREAQRGRGGNENQGSFFSVGWGWGWRGNTWEDGNEKHLSGMVQVLVERGRTRAGVENGEAWHLRGGQVVQGNRKTQCVERGVDRRMDGQGRKEGSCPQKIRWLPLVGLGSFLSTQGTHKRVHLAKVLFSDAQTLHVIPLGTRVAFHHV